MYFSGHLVKTSLGREIYALSEMADRKALIQGFCEPFEGASPVHTSGDQEGDYGGVSGPASFGWPTGLGQGELGIINWLSGIENLVGGLPKVCLRPCCTY